MDYEEFRRFLDLAIIRDQADPQHRSAFKLAVEHSLRLHIGLLEHALTTLRANQNTIGSEMFDFIYDHSLDAIAEKGATCTAIRNGKEWHFGGRITSEEWMLTDADKLRAELAGVKAQLDGAKAACEQLLSSSKKSELDESHN